MSKKTRSASKRILGLVLVFVMLVGVMAVGLAAVAANPPAWDPGKPYVAGERVTYENNIYQAAWWTQGNVPTAGAPWTYVGPAEDESIIDPNPDPNFPGCTGSPTVDPVELVINMNGQRDYVGFYQVYGTTTGMGTLYYEGLSDPAASQREITRRGTYIVFLCAQQPAWYVTSYADCVLLTLDAHGCVKAQGASANASGYTVLPTNNYKISAGYGGVSLDWVGSNQGEQVIPTNKFLGEDIDSEYPEDNRGIVYGKGVTDSTLESWGQMGKNASLEFNDGKKQLFSINYNKDMIAALGAPARANGIEPLKSEMSDYYPEAKAANEQYMTHDTYQYSEYYLHDRYVQGVWDTMPAAFGWMQDEYTEAGIIVRQLYDAQYQISGKSYGLAGGGQNPWVLCDYLEKNAGYYDYETGTTVEGTNAGAGWYKGYDEVSEVPYLWYPEEGVFLSYENKKSLTARCEYVKNENLGGVIIWELSGDNTYNYPMVTRTYNALGGENSGKKIVGYFTNWSVYNAYHQNQRPEDLPLDMLTHVNYSFFQVGGYYERGIVAPANELNSMDRWADDYSSVDPGENAQDMIPAFGQMKQQYPDFKLLISVGGWTRGDGFNGMVTSPQNRATFVNSVSRFLDKYPFFDGVDLDWEYPSNNRLPDFDDPNDLGSPSSAGGNFETYTSLCNELRTMLNTKGNRNILTACIPAAPGNIKDKQNLKAIADACTFINAMTYDYHGAFDPTIGHNSPLYPSIEQPDVAPEAREWATSNSVDFYKALGVPTTKINIGTPFYSRGWAGVKADADGNPQPLTDPTPIFPSTSAPDPASITVIPSERTVNVGETFRISASVLPANANQNVSWSTSDDSVATTDGRDVNTFKVGTATITATTANGLTATCVVTVVDPNQDEALPYAVVKVGEDKWYNIYEDALWDCGYDVIIEDGRAFLPFRFAGELLGGEVDWDDDTQTAILRYEYFNYEFRFTIGSNIAKCYHINGTPYPIFDRTLQNSEIPFISNGRTYLPARVLAETTRLLEDEVNGIIGTDRYIAYESTPSGEYLIYSVFALPTDAQTASVIALAEAKYN